MDHAITFGDILHLAAIAGGFLFVAAFFVALLYILNPFRSGH